MSTPRIAIIYLSFHCEPYIDDVVAALEAVTYPHDALEFIIVDNPHPTHGHSIPYLEKNVMPKSGASLPHVTLLPQEKNIGFGPGNNAGVAWALAHNFDYVFFLNNDAYPGPDTFEPLVAAFEADTRVGIAQSLLLLHPRRDLINSSGNMIQFCGFGYCRDYQVPLAERVGAAAPHQLKEFEDIPYASGAAFMVPTALIKKCGAWEEDFWMYHEDMEWSLRLKSRGYRVVLARDSHVYHAYEFQRSITKYFWMERNRFGVLLMFLKIPTLILIFPALALYEIGTYLFAWRGGWWREKHKLYTYWVRPATWRMWITKRRAIQTARTISDAALTRNWVGFITFQESRIENPVLRYIANPLMCAYWWLAKKIIFW